MSTNRLARLVLCMSAMRWLPGSVVISMLLATACTAEVENALDDEDGVGQIEATTDCGGFQDVPANTYYCDAADRIREAGITAGCNPPENTRFCPDSVVSRGEMATFLVRALALPAGSFPCGFTDVTSTNVHRFNICAVKAAGITVGCNPPDNTRFCPADGTTRGQMAAFLARALALPGCSISNYTDVSSSHVFASSICAIWRAGIGVSYRHPDPVNNRYNNTYGPDAPMLRRDLAVFLDRAVVRPPDRPLLATVSSTYQQIMTDAMAYKLSSNVTHRAGEVQSLVYLYRAARKVRNPPAGFSLATIQSKIIAGADQIMTMYRTDCFTGHDGDGTSTFGCARFNEQTTGENLDAGSGYPIALLEATRLLFEIGGAANVDKGKSYFTRALHNVAHMNDDHRVTSPCVGWEVDATPGTYNGMIKWNKSNRWAMANFLVHDVRSRWNAHVGGDGEPYRSNAVAALTCFRNDLRNASKYRCNGQARCYDSERGPWWTGWHSAYSTGSPPRIEEDPGHGSATAEIVFSAVYDRWGVLDGYDLQQFARHFEQRRVANKTATRSDGGIGRMFYVPQYPDSTPYPGNTCAQGVSCTEVASDWDSRKTDAWLRIASLYGYNPLRTTIQNLEPSWNRIESGSAPALRVGAFSLFGEVGSPRRLTN